MDSKKFLFLSLDAALIADIAWRVHEEGHDVKYYVEAESDTEIGDGFVEPANFNFEHKMWGPSFIFPQKTRTETQTVAP